MSERQVIRMKVVRRPRLLGVIETDEELATLLAGVAGTDDEQGWRGTVTTDRWLALAGGLLGGALTCLGLLVKYGQHLNHTSKGHRP